MFVEDHLSQKISANATIRIQLLLMILLRHRNTFPWHCLQTNRNEKVMHSKIISKLRALWDSAHHSNTCILDKVSSETWSPCWCIWTYLLIWLLVMLAQPTRQLLEFCYTVILRGTVLTWVWTITSGGVMLLLLPIRWISNMPLLWHFVLRIYSLVIYYHYTLLLHK